MFSGPWGNFCCQILKLGLWLFLGSGLGNILILLLPEYINFAFPEYIDFALPDDELVSCSCLNPVNQLVVWTRTVSVRRSNLSHNQDNDADNCRCSIYFQKHSR